MTAQVTHNLGLLADAPAGVHRLRTLILELAVAGRLLESDGEAQEFLIEEFCSVQGGIQKTPLRSPLKHHFPYLRVANVQRGRIDTSRLERYELLPEELDRWRLVPGDLLIVEGNGSESEIGRCAIWRGEVPNCVFQNHLIRVRPEPEASVDFLALYLNSPVGTAHMRRLAITTSGLFNLSVGKIRSIPVRLPPLAEQHRIVAKVDELMTLCDRLEARQQDAEAAHAQLVQALLDSLTQARDADEFQACWQRLAEQFQYLFSSKSSVDLLSNALMSMAVSGRLVAHHPGDESAELLLLRLDADAHEFCTKQKVPRAPTLAVRGDDVPFEAPNGWAWTRLGSLFRVITDGDHQAPPQTTEGIAFLTIGNVTNGYLDFDQCRTVEPSYFDGLAQYRKPAAGDLLYTVVGATYGRPVLVETDRPFCVQRHIAILKRSELLCARFALLLLKSPLVYSQASASTTGTAQPTIPLKPLRNLLVPLPPLAEQHRIVAKVDELFAVCDQLKARIAAARAKHAQLAQALVEAAVA